MQYAMSVIVGRALPDVRDGLKPVHRRILYAMQELGLQPTTPYRHALRHAIVTLSPVTIWHFSRAAKAHRLQLWRHVFGHLFSFYASFAFQSTE